MITKQRKIIYLAAIAILVVASIILLTQNSRTDPAVNLSPGAQTANLPELAAPKAYVLPKVFPNDTAFDLSVFKSSFFQTLQPAEEIKVEQGELGRENPFKKY